MSKRISSTLFLKPTNPAEVSNIISSLKTSKSSGYDNISSFLLKSAIKVLVFPLAHLFNCPFKLGMFPDCLKVAKVLPVYKSGEKSELCNYPPISIFFQYFQSIRKAYTYTIVNFFKQAFDSFFNSLRIQSKSLHYTCFIRCYNFFL